jgi:hypothetical protein
VATNTVAARSDYNRTLRLCGEASASIGRAVDPRAMVQRIRRRPTIAALRRRPEIIAPGRARTAPTPSCRRRPASTTFPHAGSKVVDADRSLPPDACSGDRHDGANASACQQLIRSLLGVDLAVGCRYYEHSPADSLNSLKQQASVSPGLICQRKATPHRPDGRKKGMQSISIICYALTPPVPCTGRAICNRWWPSWWICFLSNE